MLWLTRRITATLAADGPIASTPAASVAAWAVTPRRARSALDLAYCSLNPPACSGTIIAAARSTAAAGALGENDATVSAIPVARCTTSRESRLKSRSGVVQRRYPVTTAAEIAAAHRKTTASRSPGASSSVPTVTESRRNSQKLIATPSTTSSTNTEHVETHHRGQPSKTPIAARAAIVASGARTSNTTSRQAFLIESTPTGRSSACRPHRRHRAASSSARSGVWRRRSH
ncbi:Uncharacterised protein [Mycobacterium tuberculosis]|nr:Uncharacterised protein [Mycobacterium tuberculosis]